MPERYVYQIKAASENSWTDISRLINSADTTITHALCTTEWKSATNTASFSLRYADASMYKSVLTKILNAMDEGERIDVRITDISTGKQVFSGWLDNSSLDISSAIIPQSLSLVARDYIVLLDDKITINIVHESESVRSIVAGLLYQAGYIGSLRCDIPDTRTIPYFVVTSDDGKSYREVIDQLLFECGGYVLYRDPEDDIYEINKIVPEGDPERIVHYVVSDALATSAEIFDYDGIRIIYPTVSLKANAVLYVADIQTSIEDGELAGEEIPAGHYYPEDGDITPTYQEYDDSLLDRAYQTSQSRKQNEDISLLYAKNARVNINPGTGFDFPVLSSIGMEVNPAFLPRKAWVLLRNNTSGPLDLFSFTIEGEAVYKSRLNRVTIPDTSKNPDEYETEFIFSQEEAVSFGTFYLNFRKYSATITTWTEKDLESKLGEKVIVRHKGTDISQAHVVVQINDESYSGGVRCYRVTAVSVSGYSSYSWAAESSTGSVVSKQVVSDTQQYYYSSSYDSLQDGTWVDAPEEHPGTALWLRRKVVYSDGSIWLGDPYCVSPDPSGNDSAPKYYFKYTKTNDPDAWKGGGILFVHGSKLLTAGHILLTAGMGGWLDHVPEGSQYADDFLWTKIVHADGSVDIIPHPQKGEPAYGIDIAAEPAAYQLTSRGVVRDNPATITLVVIRHYVTARAVWSISPSNDEIKLTPNESNTDIATVTIAQGSKIKSFSVTVEIDEKDISATIIVAGVDGGVAVSHYFGIYPLDEADARPSYFKDTGYIDFGNSVFPDYVDGVGPIQEGDYVIFMTDVYAASTDEEPTSTEPIPYYYTGSVWAMVNEQSPDYSEIMGTMLGDVTAMPDMPITTGAFYGFFQNLAAQAAFINRLFANYIKLGGAIYGGGYDAEGNNPTNANGFYLDKDGQLRAVGIVAVDGIFSGRFSSTAMNTVTFVPSISSSDVQEEYRDYWDAADCRPEQYDVEIAVEGYFAELTSIGDYNGDRSRYMKSWEYYVGNTVISLRYDQLDRRDELLVLTLSGTVITQQKYTNASGLFCLKGLSLTEMVSYAISSQRVSVNIVQRAANSGTYSVKKQVYQSAYTGSSVVRCTPGLLCGIVTEESEGDCRLEAFLIDSAGNIISNVLDISTGVCNHPTVCNEQAMIVWEQSGSSVKSDLVYYIYASNGSVSYTTFSSSAIYLLGGDVYEYLGDGIVGKKNNSSYVYQLLSITDSGVSASGTLSPSPICLTMDRDGYFGGIENGYIDSYKVSGLSATRLRHDFVASDFEYYWASYSFADHIAMHSGYYYSGKGWKVQSEYTYPETRTRYWVDRICDFFSAIKPKLLPTWNKGTPPEEEPLMYQQNVSATAVMSGGNRTITVARITESSIYLTDVAGNELEFSIDDSLDYDLRILNLEILSTPDSLEVSNLYPLYSGIGGNETSIGTEARKFDDVWSKVLHGDQLYVDGRLVQIGSDGILRAN